MTWNWKVIPCPHPHLEYQLLSQLLSNLVLGDEEVDETLHNVGGRTLAGMLPSHHHHHPLLYLQFKERAPQIPMYLSSPSWPGGRFQSQPTLAQWWSTDPGSSLAELKASTLASILKPCLNHLQLSCQQPLWWPCPDESPQAVGWKPAPCMAERERC